MKSTIKLFQLFAFFLILVSPFHSNAQCEISNITVETFDCSGEFFYGEINFEYSGDVGDFFSYSITGQQDGEYPYDQLPMGLDFIAVTDLDFLTITISDDTGTGCSSTSEFENPCFENCYIFGLTAVPGECNSEDEFDLVVDFDYTYTSDFFDLHINYENGLVIEDIAYTSLPYTVTGLTEECISDIDIVVYDSEDDGCWTAIGIDPVCCSYDLCMLENMIVEVSECDGTEFALDIDFDFIGTTDEFDYILYDYQSNQVETGSYAYADLPLSLSIDNTTSNGYTIVITDQEDSSCIINEYFDNPCYEECNLYNLTAIPNNCVDGTFNLVVDFDHEFTSGSFDLHITYPYGFIIESIPYTSLPYTVTGLEEDCNSDIEILVCDSEIGGCLDVIELPPVCCANFCIFENIVIDISECDGSEFAAIIDFDYSGNVVEFDYILYNSQSNQIETGSYAYADLPLSISIDNTTSIVYYIVITDQEDPTCVIDEYFDNPCYEGDCFIGNITVTQGDCNEDGFFNVTLDFEYENTSDQFTVNGNGINYGTFLYADLPITIEGLEANCETGFEFVVHDVNNNNCTSDTEIGVVCCEDEDCVFEDLVLGASECEGGIFDLEINFSYTGNTNDFFDYIVYDQLNEIITQGTSEYANLPLIIQVENSESQNLLVAIYDNDNDGCNIDQGLDNPCYESQGDCFIGNVAVTQGDCTEDGFFNVTLDFDYGNTSDQFTVNGNGNSYGTFSYADLPITIEELEGDCETEFEFIVSDVNNNDCTNFAGLDPVCCEDEDCVFEDLVLGASECEGGIFDLEINFSYTGNTNDFFDYIVYDQLNEIITQGTSEYANLPLIIQVENSESQNLLVAIYDNDNDGCNIDQGLDNPCYESQGDCFIGNITVTQGDCNENGFFNVTLDFEYDNTSDQFTVNGNGNSYGDFSYADLPITIEELEGDCVTEFEFVVHDVNNNDCTNFAGLDPVCCEDDECQMTTLDFGENPVCENGLIVTEWLIDGENISEVGYDIFINGEFQFFIEYEVDSWYDFDITAPETENFTMTVCDNDNADCCITWELDNPCYEEEACNINSIDFGNNPICENGQIVTQWFIFAENTSEVGFDIYVNNEFLLFVEYNGEGPYEFDIPDPETENFTLTVCDNDDADCCYTWELDNPCYDETACSITDLTAEVISCDNDLFDVVIDFDYSNVTNQFMINGNGTNYGTFTYTDLPITLTGLDADCDTDYEFIVQDVIFDDCIEDIGLGPVCCEDFNMIDNISLTTIIDGETFMITFNVESTLLDGCALELFIGDELVEMITDSDTQITIGPFECGTDQVLQVEVKNTCTDEVITFDVDLGEIECTVGVVNVLDDVKTNWDAYGKTLSIDSAGDFQMGLELMTTNGSLVYKESNVRNGWNKSFDNLTSGIYFIRFTDVDSQKSTIKKVFVF